MVDEWIIRLIVICVFASGFALGWKAGCSFERREDAKIQ